MPLQRMEMPFFAPLQRMEIPFFAPFATNGDAFFRAREENAQGLRMSSQNKNAYAQYAEGNRWKKLDSGFKSRKM